MDWVGQKLGIPLYEWLGLDPADTPLTTFSIGIDTPEITKQKTREAADYPILKVKVGLSTDEPTIEAVRSVTGKKLRVDANEGWKDKEEAVRKINWLEQHGVEFIEQPMPAEMIEETRWVRSRVHIPIIADEACQRASDIPKLKDAFDGVNVKLDKAGGILEARRMIDMSRSRWGCGPCWVHGIELGDGYRGGASFAAGGLCRSRRQPADLQRPVPRVKGREREN
jgi:L-alanine-DL-glutamate epimerase-like enolase superfamily enzyme